MGGNWQIILALIARILGTVMEVQYGGSD